MLMAMTGRVLPAQQCGTSSIMKTAGPMHGALELEKVSEGRTYFTVSIACFTVSSVSSENMNTAIGIPEQACVVESI